MRTTKTTCALDHLLPSFILPRIKAEPDQAVHAWQEDQIRGSPCMTGEPKLSRPCCCTLWGNYGLIRGGWLPKAAACFACVQKRGELCWQHIIYTTVSTSSSKWEREVAWGIACGSCDLILRGSGPFVNESGSDVLNVWIPNRIANFSRKGLLPESLWLL